MEKYIFLTTDIHIMGGIQSYVAGKVDYLKKNGYDVSVFFIGKSGGRCVIKPLQEYVGGGVAEIGYPPYMWPHCVVNRVIKQIIKAIDNVSQYEKITIESHDDTTSQWGEILASRLQAKHFCLICNEHFRGKHKFFENKLDFYNFKLDRKEIAGIKPVSLCLLFEGYRTLEPHEQYTLVPAALKAVQDIEDSRVEQVHPADFVICYVGRIVKAYVPNIIQGILDFSKLNANKNIEVVFVGEVGAQRDAIIGKFAPLENVSLVFLGDMSPIPKKLFSRVDVVIAGSGSARCAATAGALTLIAAADNCLCNGLFGYDTLNNLYRDPEVQQTDFCEALCNVLLKRTYEGKPYCLPPTKQPEDHYKDHLTFISASATSKQYYDERHLCEHGKMHSGKLIKLYISTYFPKITNWYVRMRKLREAKHDVNV